MREVRFCLDAAPSDPVLNSWAGWPDDGRIAPYLVLRATVSGPVDRRTGYMCNITLIDRLLRDQAIPHLQRTWSTTGGSGGARLAGPAAVAALWGRLEGHTPGGTRLESLQLASTPYRSFTACRGDLPMITMTESFEFAASHRLFCADLPDDRNREIFGKCSNPNGHGHNYVLEVSVAGEPDPGSGTVMDHARFQRTVKQHVIDRFDHTHLNSDVGEFARLNPTVENITRVIWDLLVDQFHPARLARVRVWETPKTWAEYAGP